MTALVEHDIPHTFELGYQQYQRANYESALRLFYQVWIAIPKPQKEHAMAGEILTAIGSTYFQLQRYKPAIEALRSALDLPNMTNNPLTLIRLGQCLLDSDQEAQGRAYLQRAHRIGGAEIFHKEDHRYISAIMDLVA